MRKLWSEYNDFVLFMNEISYWGVSDITNHNEKGMITKTNKEYSNREGDLLSKILLSRNRFYNCIVPVRSQRNFRDWIYESWIRGLELFLLEEYQKCSSMDHVLDVIRWFKANLRAEVDELGGGTDKSQLVVLHATTPNRNDSYKTVPWGLHMHVLRQ